MRCEESLGEVFADVGTETARHRQRKMSPGSGQERRVAGGTRPRPTVAATRRYRVPEQRFLSRAPLPLEAIGPRVTGRAAKIEPSKALLTSRANRLPVQEHVRTEPQVRAQAGSPGH